MDPVHYPGIHQHVLIRFQKTDLRYQMYDTRCMTPEFYDNQKVKRRSYETFMANFVESLFYVKNMAE